MKNNHIKMVMLFVLLLNTAGFNYAQTTKKAKTATTANLTKLNKSALQIKQKDIRSHMEFLASDAMQGRGSGTIFELIAGRYLASQMQQFGIEPAGDENPDSRKDYIQTVNISQNTFVEAPKINFSLNGANVAFEHGKEMIVFRMSAANVSGPLQILSAGEKPKKDSIVYIGAEEGMSQDIGQLLDSGAAAIIMQETPRWRGGWDRFASRPVSFQDFSNTTTGASTALLVVSNDAAKSLEKLADGTKIEIGGKLGETKIRQTWNSVGMIKGSDSKLSKEVILLSAHMDHIGVRENSPGDDKIFNGADDDASGCVAVLELARIMASGERPKRTVYFAFFGSEEAGGYGSRFFVNNLPFEKANFVANLQFEMLGRPDAKVGKDELWLTGYERSNLGSELAKNGAKLVKDPHPQENFFRRSDNYALARQGIIAHTVSSFGLHKDYHQASDEIKTIDFEYLTNATNSMIKSIQWLVNSDFKPSWYEGMQP
jgi:hypothetical protein